MNYVLSFPLDKGTSTPTQTAVVEQNGNTCGDNQGFVMQEIRRETRLYWCTYPAQSKMEKNCLTPSWATVPIIPDVSTISLGFLERSHQPGWKKNNIPSTALLHLPRNHSPSESHWPLIQKFNINMIRRNTLCYCFYFDVRLHKVVLASSCLPHHQYTVNWWTEVFLHENK